MYLANLQKRVLIGLLREENMDLEGTLLEVVFPTSTKNIFSRKKGRLIRIFREIESRIKERADPIYEEDAEKFREVGGYFLIKQNRSRYSLESIFETEGETGSQIVLPGRGLVISWSCTFPDINTLDIEWESTVSFVKYHSHPFTNYPSPQDITEVIRNLRDIPKNVEFFQAIYSNGWAPNFLWLKHQW